VYFMGSSRVLEKISVAFALLPAIWYAPRLVSQAFVLFLLCSAPHPVMRFPTWLYPVGFEGRKHYRTQLQERSVG